MSKFSQTNWFIWIVSLVPGLGIMILGKRKMGSGVLLAIFLLFAIFWFVPNLITWFIFGVAFIAQMAYAVGLATFQSTKRETTLDSNLSRPLPPKFSNRKQIATKVSDSLSTILGSGEQLKAAIIGLEEDTTQFMFVGITGEHLILSQCNQAGDPYNPQRIMIDNVSWVSLEIGERNLLLSIEYDNGKELGLHVLGKLHKQTLSIIEDFPGTWSRKDFMEGFKSLQKENNRLSAIYFVCFVIVLAGIFLSASLPPPLDKIVIALFISIFFFVLGWPNFIGYIRKLKKEPGVTSSNVMASLPMIQVLFFWLVSLFSTGLIAISIVKSLHALG